MSGRRRRVPTQPRAVSDAPLLTRAPGAHVRRGSHRPARPAVRLLLHADALALARQVARRGRPRGRGPAGESAQTRRHAHVRLQGDSSPARALAPRRRGAARRADRPDQDPPTAAGPAASSRADAVATGRRRARLAVPRRGGAARPRRARVGPPWISMRLERAARGAPGPRRRSRVAEHASQAGNNRGRRRDPRAGQVKPGV